MNTLNLENVGLIELNNEELKETGGGDFGTSVAVGVTVYLIISSIEYPKSFLKGLLGQ